MKLDKSAMVVAAQPEAAEAAVDILRAGGNAVDAAVACALVQGVVDPMMCGIGGFGSCGILMAESGFHGYVDFHAPAPRSVRPGMWADRIEGETQDGFGFVLRDRVNDLGYQSICTPASLRGYHAAHAAHGRLPWEAVVEPSVGWAQDGWTVRPAVEAFWAEPEDRGRAANDERLALTPASRKLYCGEDGAPKRVGDRVVNRELAEVLRLIAKHGDAVFYEGEIAHAIAEDMERHSGLVGLDDLRLCEARQAAPLWGSYKEYRVATNNPPGGGIALLEMLNVLEQFPVPELGHNTPEYLRVLIEAMKMATRDEDRWVGDPGFVEVPVDRLTSKAYARELADGIRSGERASLPRLRLGNTEQHTTQVLVVDRDGNCVTMTHSLGMPSGVITDGLGFMYNGCMGVFDPRSGNAGSLAPGKARISAIAPSMVFRGDQLYVVIGAPGGPHITMAILQVLLNVLEFGMTMTEAVSATRVYATSDAIDVFNRLPMAVQEELEGAGHEVNRSPYSFGAACVYCIRRSGGELDGGADPGEDGVVFAA
jgi:gamma-glutamyltranspeptidase/glutathione hydrolase